MVLSFQSGLDLSLRSVGRIDLGLVSPARMDLDRSKQLFEFLYLVLDDNNWLFFDFDSSRRDLQIFDRRMVVFRPGCGD